MSASGGRTPTALDGELPGNGAVGLRSAVVLEPSGSQGTVVMLQADVEPGVGRWGSPSTATSADGSFDVERSLSNDDAIRRGRWSGRCPRAVGNLSADPSLGSPGLVHGRNQHRWLV